MAEENQEQRFCRQCGARVQSGIAFCTSCGAPLGASPGGSPTTTPGSQGRAGNPIPPLIQRHDPQGRQQQTNARRLGTWYGNLSRASKRGLVAVSVLAVVVAASLIAASTSSGDWDSERAYVSDIQGSYSGISNIRDSVSNTIYAYENDSYTMMEDVEDEVSSAQDDLETHIDYFEGSTPPSGYREFQDISLDAWYTFDEALQVLEDAYYYGDPELVDEGTELMDDFYLLLEESEDALPDTEESERLESLPLSDDSSTF